MARPNIQLRTPSRRLRNATKEDVIMEYTCYSCGKEVECAHCGHEYWEEGITYDSTKYSLELQEKLVYDHECCECGSIRVEM